MAAFHLSFVCECKINAVQYTKGDHSNCYSVNVARRRPKRPLVERGAAVWRGWPMKPGLLWWMRFLQIVWCTLSLRTYADRNAMELKLVRLCLSLFTYRLALGIYMESAPAALRDALNWAQAKAFPLHFGWVDACGSPRCGLFGTYLLRVGLGNSIPSHPPPTPPSRLPLLPYIVLFECDTDLIIILKLLVSVHNAEKYMKCKIDSGIDSSSAIFGLLRLL